LFEIKLAFDGFYPHPGQGRVSLGILCPKHVLVPFPMQHRDLKHVLVPFPMQHRDPRKRSIVSEGSRTRILELI